MLTALRDATRRLHLPADSAPPAPARWFGRDEAIMGSAIHVELWHDDAAMSPYKNHSLLSQVNRDAAQRPVPVSAELCDPLACAQRFSEFSDGVFDITYAAAGHLYDYRRGIRIGDSTAPWRVSLPLAAEVNWGFGAARP